MSNPPKIRIVCSHCRSESVTRDANASWNPDTQDWELEGVMDAAYCNDCGGECSLEEVPYRPRRDGLNSDFAKLHEDLTYGDADMLSKDELKAAAGCVLALMRIQDALNRSPEWDSETMDAVAAQVRAAGLPLLDADDAALDAEELADKYAGKEGSWGEHPIFRRQEWREEVANDDTLQGYWAWVVSKLNEE